MKRILVTGGAGFIGSNAIEYFLAHYPEYLIINLDKMTYAASLSNMSSFIDNPNHFFIKGDICDAQLVDKIFKDYDITDVIHFAAESHVDNSINGPDIFIKTNIMGTFTLLEAARKHWQINKDDKRFHHISTDEVFGSLGMDGYFTESSQYAPNSPYSASKASSDHLVRSYFKTYGLNTVITNCSNNYGPHQHSEKLIPTIIRKALNNEPIPIYGAGNNIRDWLYVKDHCEAISSVFHQAMPGEHFNIGGNHEVCNLDLAKLICRLLDEVLPSENGPYSHLITHVKDRAGHDFRYAVSTDKIKTLLGWRPKTPFNLGIKKTIKYYLNLIPMQTH